MPTEARRPSPIARITVAAPSTMSPPANTPGIDVMFVSGLTTMLPRLLTSSPSVVAGISGLEALPTATMTVSVGMVILRATKTGEENYVIISNNCLRLGSHEAQGSKGEHS